MAVIYRIRHSPPVRKFGKAPMVLTADAYGSNPIKSPVDGRVIDSRQALREHNERNGVVDIGDDSVGLRDQHGVNRGGEDLRADLEETYGELSVTR